MSISVLPGEVRVTPPFPVEIPVSVDGTTMRVAIEWNAIARALPAGEQSIPAVTEVLRGQRAKIELALRAHLAAHGVPMDRRIVINAADIDDAGS